MRSYKSDKPGIISDERKKAMEDAHKAFESVCKSHKLTAVIHYAAPEAPVSTIGFVPDDVDDIEAHKKTLKAIKDEPNKNDQIGKITTALKFELDNVAQISANKQAEKNAPSTAKTLGPSDDAVDTKKAGDTKPAEKSHDKHGKKKH